MTDIQPDAQTFQIIGAAMEVHRQLHRDVIVEVKAISALTPADEAQILNYLAISRIRRGLLMNFGTKSLEYKRRVL
jgi:hypothetical protein